MLLLRQLSPHLHRSSCPHARFLGCRPIRLVSRASAPVEELKEAREQQIASSPSVESTADVLQAIQQKLGCLNSSPLVPPAKPLVTVISGPSGVGKDAVIKALQTARPDLHFVITATTRDKRPGEVHGVDYLFVNKGEFEEWIATGQLIEHAVVYGQYKGIPRTQVTDALRRGTDVVLRLDIQGAATIRTLMPDVLSIFLAAESEEALVRRLVDRKTEPLGSMLLRVQAAREELQAAREFDYVVLNCDGQLAEAVSDIEAILRAEKLRMSRRTSLSGLLAESEQPVGVPNLEKLVPV